MVFRCNGCKLVSYADTLTRQDQRFVFSMENHLNNKQKTDCNQFLSTISPADYSKLVSIVGEKCLICCLLNGNKTQILWDTGAQVSLITESHLQRFSPKATVEDIATLLDNNLRLTAANGTDIPFCGWVKLPFQLENSNTTLLVPFLVTKERLDTPIIGYNVIAELSKQKGFSALNSQLFPGVANVDINQVTGILQKSSEEDLCTIKTSKKDHILQPGQSISLSLQTRIGPIQKVTPVLFEPDETGQIPAGLNVTDTLLSLKPGRSPTVSITVFNTHSNSITLPGRTVLGKLNLVKSVTPVDIENKSGFAIHNGQNKDHVACNGVTSQRNDRTPGIPAHLEGIKLDGLSDEQNEKALDLLKECQDVFAKDSDDVGSMLSLSMHINLKDNVPVQKN